MEKHVGNLERQLASEKRKNSILNKELRRLHDENLATSERMDLLLETSDSINAKKLHKVVKSSKSQATAILCANDWHAEERVDADDVNGLNEFNLDIAKRRIDRLWSKAIYLLDFSQHVAKIDDLVLWLGGDLINGVIAQEMEEYNFLGPTEAIMWIQDRVVEGINFLLPHFKHITVVTSGGNHGRATQKKRIGTWWRHSWEYLAYQNLSRYYANNSKVSFKIEKSYHNWLDIQGRAVRFHHGDAVKFSGGIGGITIPLKKKIGQWNKAKPAYLDIIGHFHQHESTWNYVISGCLVGANAYAIDIGAELQEPTQTWIVMDRNHGRTVTLPIFVEEHARV